MRTAKPRTCPGYKCTGCGKPSHPKSKFCEEHRRMWYQDYYQRKKGHLQGLRLKRKVAKADGTWDKTTRRILSSRMCRAVKRDHLPPAYFAKDIQHLRVDRMARVVTGILKGTVEYVPLKIVRTA